VIRTAIGENRSLKGILEKVGCGTQFPLSNPTGKGILISGIALGIISHRDVKVSNILLDGRGQTPISDFSLSHSKSPDYTPEGGTVSDAAPELFDAQFSRCKMMFLLLDW
jgi:serine/threonine protein kinase